MNKEQHYIQEDEIDLRELFLTLWKKRWFITIFTVIVTIVSIVYAYMKTPIYEVKSNVRVGYINSDPIENPDIIVKMLKIVFNVEDKIANQEKSSAEVSKIIANKNLKNFIEIKTQATSNDKALKKNREVLSFLQEYYQPKIKKYIKEKKNSIDNKKRQIRTIDTFEKQNIQKQIEVLQNQKIVQIDEKIQFLLNNKIPSLNKRVRFHEQRLSKYRIEIDKILNNMKNKDKQNASVIVSLQMVNYQNLMLNAQNKIEELKLEIENIRDIVIVNLQREKENISTDDIRKLQHRLNVVTENKKIKLGQEIETLQYEISSKNIKNSFVVGDYVVRDYPIKPKKKLIVIVAFVTGFILSVFLVFLMEFIKGFKEEENF